MTNASLVRCLGGLLALALAAGCGDDDIPSGAAIEVVDDSGLRTTEAGGEDTFSVRLTAIPTSRIVVELSSSDVAEGKVAPRTIEFTEDNWDSGVTVTVIGVDDDVVDGDKAFKVVVEAGNAGSDEVSVTNADDDGPGVTVTPTTGLETTEAGGGAAFTIALNTMPTAAVTIPVASDDPTEGAAVPASLTFTSENWSSPQIVTVTGENDDEADGEKAYTIIVGAATSDDPTYDGFDPTDVGVANIDDDSPGIFVTPKTGLETSESGDSDDFTVVLNTQPSAAVTIALTSNAPDEGLPSPVSLTFTADNWDAPQTVTVTGVNDEIADGAQAYTIVLAAATSLDVGYQGVDGDDVSITNSDDDSPGIQVTPTAGLETTEAGGSDTFEVRLLSQPTADVTIGVASDAPLEGSTDVASLTFTTDNWNSPQTVTVTGVDDPLDDGSQPYTIELAAATSGDAGYLGLDADDVAVTNVDDETPGFTVTPTSGLTTTEDGGDASFTVALVSQPTASVSIDVVSSDATEGVASPVTLTFTEADWDVPQTVTVVGQDDVGGDGDQPYAILLAAAVSADPAYAGFDAPDVSMTNIDNDSPGITISQPFGLLVSEFGDTDTFDIVLNSEPIADVSIALTSQRPGEATVSPTSVTFTAADWFTPQTVTVTGVDDAIVDGSQVFEIITGLASSADPGYSGRNAVNAHVTNFDNDTAGVLVTGDSLLQVTEGGGTATFDMVLTVAPTANVTCPVSSSDTAEGTVDVASVVFTPANFDTPQTVTVTGVDDAEADGNQLFFILTAKCASTDLAYKNVNPRDLNARNLDDD